MGTTTLTKKNVLLFIIGIMIIMNPLISFAQSASPDMIADSEVLVSNSPTNYPQANQILETPLVDIKAVDSPSMHSQDGKTGMASNERFGHGVVIDPSGVIVTSTHIIANAQHIYVNLANGKTFEASLIYSSQPDFSFIKINTPFSLKAIIWGNSSQVQIGKPVIALKTFDSNSQNNLGGEVTNLIKETPSGNVELLELKIPLKPGDSGGPVTDEQGRLLGLIMANRKSDKSESYAIASNLIQEEYTKFRGAQLIAQNDTLTI